MKLMEIVIALLIVNGVLIPMAITTHAPFGLEYLLLTIAGLVDFVFLYNIGVAIYLLKKSRKSKNIQGKS